MSKLISKFSLCWNRFWFSRQPTYSFGIFRILFGLYLLLTFIISFPNWERFYGTNGTLALSDIVFAEQFSLFSLTDNPLLLWLIYGVAVCCSLTLVVGFKTRLSTVILFIIYASMNHRNPLLMNGQDGVAKMFLFFGCFAPLGDHLSLDEFFKYRTFRLLNSSQPVELKEVWILRLMQLSVVNMYLLSMPDKLRDFAWRDGTAFYYLSLSEPWFRYSHVDFFHSIPLSITLTIFILFIELAFILLFWGSIMKPYIISGLILFHGSSLFLMGPGVFLLGSITIIAFLLFIEPKTTKQIINRLL